MQQKKKKDNQCHHQDECKHSRIIMPQRVRISYSVLLSLTLKQSEETFQHFPACSSVASKHFRQSIQPQVETTSSRRCFAAVFLTVICILSKQGKQSLSVMRCCSCFLLSHSFLLNAVAEYEKDYTSTGFL